MSSVRGRAAPPPPGPQATGTLTVVCPWLTVKETGLEKAACLLKAAE